MEGLGWDSLLEMEAFGWMLRWDSRSLKIGSES